MVLVDRVYQRVLTLANKEQRGYITPQEFNLFANQAQMGARAVGKKDCGCNKRKEVLNKVFPYKK